MKEVRYFVQRKENVRFKDPELQIECFMQNIVANVSNTVMTIDIH